MLRGVPGASVAWRQASSATTSSSCTGLVPLQRRRPQTSRCPDPRSFIWAQMGVWELCRRLRGRRRHLRRSNGCSRGQERGLPLSPELRHLQSRRRCRPTPRREFSERDGPPRGRRAAPYCGSALISSSPALATRGCPLVPQTGTTGYLPRPRPHPKEVGWRKEKGPCRKRNDVCRTRHTQGQEESRGARGPRGGCREYPLRNCCYLQCCWNRMLDRTSQKRRYAYYGLHYRRIRMDRNPPRRNHDE